MGQFIVNNFEVILTGCLGLMTTILSGWTSWFFARKKYNSEVDNLIISNMKESLDFYKQLSDDNKERLTLVLELNKEILDQNATLLEQNTQLELKVKELEVRIKNLTDELKKFETVKEKKNEAKSRKNVLG